MCAVVVCVDDVGNIVSGNVYGTMVLDTISYIHIHKHKQPCSLCCRV